MVFRYCCVSATLLWGLSGGVFLSGVVYGQQDTLDSTYGSEIRPLLSQYCFECHSGEDSEADIDLDSFKEVADIRRATKVWIKVAEMLSSRQMPPRKSDQPPDVPALSQHDGQDGRAAGDLRGCNHAA